MNAPRYFILHYGLHDTFLIMAFTLAHPAAVLPLRKLPFVALLPLIVGSMMPDLIGFLPYQAERHLLDSHSLAGTILIDLPMGYLLLMLLLQFRSALVQPLWEPHREIIARSIDEFFTRTRCWLVAAPSLLIGSWTHIAWDRLTHESYWTYRNLPALYQPLFPDGTHQLPVYHFLQYSTSVIGLLYIGWQYLITLKRIKGGHSLTIDLRESRIHLVLGLITAALTVGLARLLMTSQESSSIYLRLSLVLKTALMCFSMLYLITGLLMARTRRRQEFQ